MVRSTRTFAATGAALVLAACATRPPPAPPRSPPPVASSTAAPEASAPPLLSSADFDAMLRAEWEKNGVRPTAPVDDARFLRRAWIDTVGVIPPPEIVLAYANDGAPDKRERMIDSLLASPRFVDHWTNVWDRVLLGRDVQRVRIDRAAFRSWLHERIAKNTPWDELVRDLVAAEGVNTSGDETPADGEPFNPAVNWVLHFDNPADLTGTTSRIFLGVQIQCAQCHDHKTEKWKVGDFDSLAACFVRTRVDQLDKGKMGPGTRRFDVKDLPNAPARKGGKKMAMDTSAYLAAKPLALDGTDFSSSPNRRAALAAWITSKQNPWFSEEIANRLVAHFLGRGFVDPVDDLRPSNPAVAPELFQKLADDVVRSGFDLRHTMRVILLSDAYRRSVAAPDPNANGMDAKLWARFRPQPMGPDELVDSLVDATKIESRLQRQGRDNIEKIKEQLRRQFTVLFDVDEVDASDDVFDGTIPQVLMLLNGRLTNEGAAAIPGTALEEILASNTTDDEKIRAMYLRTLSREPTKDEVARWVQFVSTPRDVVIPGPPPAPKDERIDPAKKRSPKDPLRSLDRGKQTRRPGKNAARRQAFEDVFWALLNSSEFLFNH